MEQLKPNCIVLSDLWGKRKAFPIKSHQQVLESHFRVHYYDSTALAEIPTHINTQDELHQAFIQGGLTKAVENLAQQKIDASYIIGYSVGGVIAWRYALQQTNVISLLAISATRLRYEKRKPACNIHLFYGTQDNYQPAPEWYQLLALSPNTITGHGHDIYRADSLTYRLLNPLIKQKS